MAWFSLLSLAAKTGLHVYQNRQNQKKYMSDAALLHAERMAQGKIEYSGKVLEAQDKGFKDEIVLFIIIMPIILIAWSAFSGDPLAREKLDLFFQYFVFFRKRKSFSKQYCFDTQKILFVENTILPLRNHV